MLFPPLFMETGPEQISVDAPAKVNLYLEIIGKRPDGFHDLRSIVVPLSFGDRLTFVLTDEEVTCTVELEGLPADSHVACSRENLATRAALLLKEHTGYAGGVRIHIVKRIPIGGGMGGGSVDAAATLRVLNGLWKTGLTTDTLAGLGGRLGCDIPILIHGRAAVMEGVGDRIHPLVAPNETLSADWWVVVVNPGFSVMTRDVYFRYKPALTCSPEIFNNLRFALMNGDVNLAAANLFNSLEPTVFAKFPLLAILRDRLMAEGAEGALLSGSGASLFALARNEEHARSLDRRIRKAMGPGLWSRVARILPDGVMAAHGPLEARV